MKNVKKMLASVLTAAMLLSTLAGATVFSVSASEEEFDYPTTHQIDSAAEYVHFVKAINAGTYTNNSDHKVNVDLDLSGYPADDVVIQNMTGDLAIDFQGHTVSGIVREVNLTNHGNVGLIADKANNFSEILNLKLKDCKLSVCSINRQDGKEDYYYAQIGAVLGYGNRSHVNGVDLENVTIELDGSGSIGLLYGKREWNDWRGADVSISMNNVLINAPGSDFGLIIGTQNNLDGDEVKIQKMAINNTTIRANKPVTQTSYVGRGDSLGDKLSIAENAEVSFNTVENATGYTDKLKPDHGYLQFREDADTLATRLVVNWNRTEIEAAKEVTLKLTFEGNFGGETSKTITQPQIKAYTQVTAGAKTYTADEGCALLGFIVTGIPYGQVTKISAALVLDGVEKPLGSTNQIPTRP